MNFLSQEDQDALQAVHTLSCTLETEQGVKTMVKRGAVESIENILYSDTMLLFPEAMACMAKISRHAPRAVSQLDYDVIGRRMQIFSENLVGLESSVPEFTYVSFIMLVRNTVEHVEDRTVLEPLIQPVCTAYSNKSCRKNALAFIVLVWGSCRESVAEHVPLRDMVRHIGRDDTCDHMLLHIVSNVTYHLGRDSLVDVETLLVRRAWKVRAKKDMGINLAKVCATFCHLEQHTKILPLLSYLLLNCVKGTTVELLINILRVIVENNTRTIPKIITPEIIEILLKDVGPAQLRIIDAVLNYGDVCTDGTFNIYATWLRDAGGVPILQQVPSGAERILARWFN